MADADEDHIPSSRPTAATTDDLDDETQDFRFLSTFSLPTTSTASPSLPRRGEKDFEPHGTQTQSATLAASRAAMHSALSYPRMHNPRQQVTAVFRPEKGMCVMERARGPHFRSMGKTDSRGVTWLKPEEALYLVERGSLDLRWPGGEKEENEGEMGKEKREEGDKERKSDGVSGAGEGEDWERWEGLPMSLQAAYALLMGRDGLSVERYVVYTGLRRAGYVVQRADGWYGALDREGGREEGTSVDQEAYRGERKPSLLEWLVGLLTGPEKEEEQKKQKEASLVGTGFYRDYASIYRRLSTIPFHDPSLSPPTFPIPPTNPAPSSPSASTLPPTNPSTYPHSDPPLLITYNIWKPSTPFKKSSPSTPDFRIVVLDARDSSFPSLTQLSDLMDDLPLDPPPERMQNNTYQKLKHGYKNVILGVVDQGVVSYLRVADAGFGKTRVWERSRGGMRGRKGGVGMGARGGRGAGNAGGGGGGGGGRGRGKRR